MQDHQLFHCLYTILAYGMFDQDGPSQSNTGNAPLSWCTQDVHGAGKARQCPSLDPTPSCGGKTLEELTERAPAVPQRGQGECYSEVSLAYG